MGPDSMPLLSPLRVLVIRGLCPIDSSLEKALSQDLVTIAGGPGEELPTGFHDIEIVETHLSSEEWKRLWDLESHRQANQRVHVCLAQPISAIICRNVLEEYRRRRTS